MDREQITPASFLRRLVSKFAMLFAFAATGFASTYVFRLLLVEQFRIDNQTMTLSLGWLVCFATCALSSGLIGGIVGRRLDSTGEDSISLSTLLALLMVFKIVEHYCFYPKQLPITVDIATMTFDEAWPYVIMPIWYILAFFGLAIAGLLIGQFGFPSLIGGGAKLTSEPSD